MESDLMNFALAMVTVFIFVTTLTPVIQRVKRGQTLRAIGYAFLVPMLWLVLFGMCLVLYVIVSPAFAKSELVPIHYNILAWQDVSPSTGAIYPPGSTDRSPSIVVPPRQPRTCPPDGPGAWSCDRHERKHNRKWR